MPREAQPFRGWVEKTATGKWRGRIRFRDGRSPVDGPSFDLKRDAQGWLADALGNLRKGTFVDPKAGQVTLADHAETYFASRVDWRPNTRASKKSCLKWLLEPPSARRPTAAGWGNTPIARLSITGVQSWITSMVDDDEEPGTIKGRFELLQQMLRAAVDTDLLLKNPCDKVNLPSYTPAEKRLLTLDEVNRLADAMEPRYRAVILVAAFSGLRLGELAGLRVDRVNFLRRRLKVTHQILQTGEFAPLKAKASERSVQVPKFVIEAISEHLHQFGPGRDNVVFSLETDDWLAHGRFRRNHFEPGVERSGIGKAVIHDLRHTAVSIWIARGANPKQVQVWAGHASIKTTFDLYGKLFPEDDVPVIAGLDDVWAATVRDQSTLRAVK